jgi:hypothetical protein
MAGAVTGFQSFSTIGNTNTTFYSATDGSGNWETGVGTYSTTGPTLTRTTILSSSNSGSAVTFSGTVNVFVAYPATRSVNLNESGNILLDFSNATLTSRNSFQTSTVNSTTGIYALPNGTSTAASWQATNNSNPTNASKILIATNGSTDVQLVSGINGTGTYLPLTFFNGGVGRFVMGTSGQFGIGPTATVSYGTSGQVLTSGGSGAAPTWSTIGSAVNTDATFDGIGSYTLAASNTAPSSFSGGTTYAGSALRGWTMQERFDTDTPQAIQATARNTATKAGTWRAMSTTNTSINSSWTPGALFVRIS